MFFEAMWRVDLLRRRTIIWYTADKVYFMPIRCCKRVQNCSARLIFKTYKRTHVSPLLAKLQWLSIAQRIQYKTSSLCYDIVSDTAPLYLSDLLCLLSLPAHCVLLLTPASFEFQQERKSSKGSVLSPILALSLGINSPTLYAMLKQNPSSKLN